MVNNKNKTVGIVLGIFALVIVTTAASFAFFTYSRTGNTTTTITSGDIEFTYEEGDSASLANAFPVSDKVGAQDTSEEYTFTVNMKSSSTANKMNYNVYLLDANDAESANYFTNEQIKYALVKNGTYVAGTSSTTGRKLSQVPGFTAGSYEGEGLVLEDQEIMANTIDEYKLRIWISDDVNYSNTSTTDDGTTVDNDSEISTGKYNGYKYSLKVKVGSGIDVEGATVLSVKNLNVNKFTMTVDLEDSKGLSAYAVTQSDTAPVSSSNEWIDLNNQSLKSVNYVANSNGLYYLHVKNVSNKTKSESFEINVDGTVASLYIMNLSKTNTDELRVDTHVATGQQMFSSTEYRYYGATPNNYVSFNDELWRIIGVMDVDNGNGMIEKRVKIIRANPIGNYSWDSSVNEINYGYGINEWSQADLMKVLNTGAYYNRTSGSCYNDLNNKASSCSFTDSGLKSNAKEMIENAKWYLGAIPQSYLTLITDEFYGFERGDESGKQCSSSSYCNDQVSRTPSLTGIIGLMYPSDYGYSVDMTKCSTTALATYSKSCKDYSWLYNNSHVQWTITPHADSTNADDVMIVYDSGSISRGRAYNPLYVSPVAYLKSDVRIIDGEGSDGKPFILSLN